MSSPYLRLFLEELPRDEREMRIIAAFVWFFSSFGIVADMYSFGPALKAFRHPEYLDGACLFRRSTVQRP